MIKLAIMLALVHGQVIMDNVYGSTWGPGGEDHPICKTCSTSQTCVKFTPGPKNPDKSLPYGTVIYRCDDANLIRFANKQTKPSAWGGFMDGYGNAYEPGEVDAPTCKECKKDITCVKFTAGPNNTILAAGTVRYRCDYAGLIRFANKQSDTGLTTGQLITDEVYGNTWAPGGEEHPICKTCPTSQTCVKFTPGPRNPDKSLPYGTVIYRCDDIRFSKR